MSETSRIALPDASAGGGWLDTPHRYGRVTRVLHWAMAGLLFWQFAGALLYVTVGDSAATRFIGTSHFSLGFLLFVLVLVRGIWGLANWKRRPLAPGSVGRLATAGHLVLYGMMILVPGIALLRQYGSGKPFAPFGIPVMSERPEKIDWMMIPADIFHYWLGFVLMALVAGHIGMVALHRWVWRQDVLSRMT
jgi:cytochrome b561